MEFTEYFRFLAALAFVLGLIGLFALAARRLGFGYPVNLVRKDASKRLDIVEMKPLDGRRRLVLVRRDHVEHLLILGQNTETVIETNIAPADQKEQVDKPATVTQISSLKADGE